MEEMLKNFALFGASGALMNTKSRFEDVPADSKSSSGTMPIGLLIFVIVLIIVFEMLLLVSTYKLTNSGWQTFFCLLFNVIYLVLAFICYGMSGYKFSKKY